MQAPRRLARRDFLGATVTAGVAAIATGAASASEDGKDKPQLPASHPARWLADKFVQWQNPYGRLDPKHCPVADGGVRVISHSFIGISLYRAYAATGVEAYKTAADRYVLFYMGWMREPEHVHSAHYGLALAAYRQFRRHNPKEKLFDARAASLFDYALAFRWDEGSYFRNGYAGGGMPDAGNSNDNCEMGRGLIAYYDLTENPRVLAEAEGLAAYFTTEVKPGTYQGCWSSELGTWVVAPTANDRFEHFENTPASRTGWGFSSVDTIEYLAELAAATRHEDLKTDIARVCAASMKWQFDACQFDDGACGMSGRDDKWWGMTAGAVLSFLRTRDAGFLSAKDVASYRPKAQAARDWLLTHATDETLKSGGYLRVTGRSRPKLDNQAWLFGWCLDALLRVDDV